MKTKHIVLATILLSQTAPAWGIDDDIQRSPGVQRQRVEESQDFGSMQNPQASRMISLAHQSIDDQQRAISNAMREVRDQNSILESCMNNVIRSRPNEPVEIELVLGRLELLEENGDGMRGNEHRHTINDHSFHRSEDTIGSGTTRHEGGAGFNILGIITASGGGGHVSVSPSRSSYSGSGSDNNHRDETRSLSLTTHRKLHLKIVPGMFKYKSAPSERIVNTSSQNLTPPLRYSQPSQHMPQVSAFNEENDEEYRRALEESKRDYERSMKEKCSSSQSLREKAQTESEGEQLARVLEESKREYERSTKEKRSSFQSLREKAQIESEDIQYFLAEQDSLWDSRQQNVSPQSIGHRLVENRSEARAKTEEELVSIAIERSLATQHK
jgi:hypothetical protein